MSRVIIDGGIDGGPLNLGLPQYTERKGGDGMLGPGAVADAHRALHVRDRTARSLGRVPDSADSPSGAPIRDGVGR